jgi:cellulose biosynthesis protein BcsQ
MIASFYSFKGGVGRTLAVAHAAWMTAARHAERELGVLVIDMDIEAPGLDRYFPFPGADACEGLAGLVEGWTQQAPARRSAWLAKALGRKRFVLQSPKLPNLRFLPSGLARRPERYGELVAFVRDEVAGQDRADGRPALATRGFFADLRAALAETPYVFVDSRTGLADAAFASTILLADVLVACVRLNLAHLDGIEPVLGSFLLREGKTSDDPAAPYLIVVTPVPSRGGEDVSKWFGGEIRRRYRRRAWEPEGAGLAPPLALVPVLHRLYEDPWLELGELEAREKLLVNDRGRARPGFDRAVPLMRGYHTLLRSLAALNAEADPTAARALARGAIRREWWASALYWWERWARDDVDAVDVVDDLLGEGMDGEVVQAAERALLQDAEPSSRGWAALLLSRSFTGPNHREFRARWIEIAASALTEPADRAEALRARVELYDADPPLFLTMRSSALQADLETAVGLLQEAGEDAKRDQALVELAQLHLRLQQFGDAAGAVTRIVDPAVASGLHAVLMNLGFPDLAARCTPSSPELGILLGWKSLLGGHSGFRFALAWHLSATSELERIAEDELTPAGRLARVQLSLLAGDLPRALRAVEGSPEPLLWTLVHALAGRLPTGRAPALSVPIAHAVDLPFPVLIEALVPRSHAFSRRAPSFLQHFDGVYGLGHTLHAVTLHSALAGPGFEEAMAILEDLCAAFPLPAAVLGRPRPLIDALVDRLALPPAATGRIQRLRALLDRYTLPDEPEVIEPLTTLPAERLRQAGNALIELSARAAMLL